MEVLAGQYHMCGLLSQDYAKKKFLLDILTCLSPIQGCWKCQMYWYVINITVYWLPKHINRPHLQLPLEHLAHRYVINQQGKSQTWLCCHDSWSEGYNTKFCLLQHSFLILTATDNHEHVRNISILMLRDVGYHAGGEPEKEQQTSTDWHDDAFFFQLSSGLNFYTDISRKDFRVTWRKATKDIKRGKQINW